MQLSHRRYRRFRRRMLRGNPLCALCLAEGRTVPATELDHIVPRHRGGQTMDKNNVQPLCADHHRTKTAKDLGVHRNQLMPCVHGVPAQAECERCQT